MNRRSFVKAAGASVLAVSQVAAARAQGLGEERPARTDHYGDSLPQAALARLGTVRFHHPGGRLVAYGQGGEDPGFGRGRRPPLEQHNG